MLKITTGMVLLYSKSRGVPKSVKLDMKTKEAPLTRLGKQSGMVIDLIIDHEEAPTLRADSVRLLGWARNALINWPTKIG
jgi:hypothetical protein